MVSFGVVLAALAALPFVVGGLLYASGAGAASVVLGVLGALAASFTVLAYSMSVSAYALGCNLGIGNGGAKQVAECIEKSTADARRAVAMPATASAVLFVLAVLAGLAFVGRR